MAEEQVTPQEEPKEPKLETQLRTARRDLNRLTKEHEEVTQELVRTQKQLDTLKQNKTYMESYYAASLSNLADQLQILQRQINITKAGGEING